MLWDLEIRRQIIWILFNYVWWQLLSNSYHFALSFCQANSTVKSLKKPPTCSPQWTRREVLKKIRVRARLTVDQEKKKQKWVNRHRNIDRCEGSTGGGGEGILTFSQRFPFLPSYAFWAAASASGPSVALTHIGSNNWVKKYKPGAKFNNDIYLAAPLELDYSIALFIQLS